MTTTVGDFLLQRLRDWGVTQVFAYPGDGINGLLGSWGRANNEPAFIQARHEEMAAFEAVGYAKFTGEVGVCAATSGPGAIHLLNGLYDAKLDHVAVGGSGGGRQPRGRGRSICSTVCMTPSSITCRWWRSSVRPSGRRWAGRIS